MNKTQIAILVLTVLAGAFTTIAAGLSSSQGQDK